MMQLRPPRSPSARKVWIEIVSISSSGCSGSSPSARKVWIEIGPASPAINIEPGHLPRGRCGLKFDSSNEVRKIEARHLPRGRCGLKFIRVCNHIYSRRSPSARKVWIEMCSVRHITSRAKRHLPRGRCGLKWLQHLDSVPCGIVTFREEGVD